MTRYNDFGSFLKKHFEGKVQKISVHAGFTCPNRDGSKGYGGCTYCNNQTFSPDYCQSDKSISQQIAEGIRFFSRKYPQMQYLAYFQSYTNTYGETAGLIQKYEEALSIPGVKGIIIGTRPDCMPEELLDYLASLSKTTFVLVEYGIESTDNQTLQQINRGHTYEDTVSAVTRTARRGILTGGHLILGLPGENRAALLEHARRLSQLPLTTLKLHQLQLIRGTRMATQYAQHPEQFQLCTADQYIELCIDFIERLRPEIVVERFISQSPPQLLIAPDWGLKNHVFTARLAKRLEERDTWQGRRYSPVSE